MLRQSFETKIKLATSFGWTIYATGESKDQMQKSMQACETENPEKEVRTLLHTTKNKRKWAVVV